MHENSGFACWAGVCGRMHEGPYDAWDTRSREGLVCMGVWVHVGVSMFVLRVVVGQGSEGEGYWAYECRGQGRCVSMLHEHMGLHTNQLGWSTGWVGKQLKHIYISNGDCLQSLIAVALAATTVA